MRADIFFRLPPQTAVLLLASVLDRTAAHIVPKLPRQTPALPTRPLHILNVVSLPPAPTTSPKLHRRQGPGGGGGGGGGGGPGGGPDARPNTICGYVGGDSGLPATCGLGSHCVLDTSHNVVGCCPDGEEDCTTGVFTGCVDEHSGAQTEADPYVYTCSGANVCYRNKFDNGYFQYGCGTASSVAATVHASASGVTAHLMVPTVSLTFHESTSRTRSSSRSSSRPTSTTSPTSSSTAAPSDSGSDRTGAIVGGTISGVAVLIALIAGGIYFYRKRRRTNKRNGPGLEPTSSTEYISPSGGGGGGGGGNSSGMRQTSRGFQPLDQNPESWGAEAVPTIPPAAVPASSPGPNYEHVITPYGDYYSGDDPHGYSDHGPGTLRAVGGDRDPLPSDMVPLTSQFDSPARGGGYQPPLGRIGEVDEEEDRVSSEQPPNSGRSTESTALNTGPAEAVTQGGSSRGSGGGRPLWQQNRKQGRNVMWM